MEIFHKAMEIFFSSTQVWQTILFISIFLFLSPWNIIFAIVKAIFVYIKRKDNKKAQNMEKKNNK